MRSQENDRPVIIISAARSGSKLLRSIIAASERFSVCGYDANYVWKYGSYSVEHDELSPADVSQAQAHRIRAFFERLRRGQEGKPLLEKTVSNSLRVHFVRKVYPDAKFIHLHRGGLQAVASTLACWQEDATSSRVQTSSDRRRKLKEFPFSMAWRYLLEYSRRYAKKRLLMQEHVESWGPRYLGIDEDLSARPLVEVCAIQWSRCVEKASESFTNSLDRIEHINVGYEDLISDPEREIQRIGDFLAVKDMRKSISHAQKVIDPKFDRKERYEGVEWTDFSLERIDQAERRRSVLLSGDPS